jgi:hypothetical protein
MGGPGRDPRRARAEGARQRTPAASSERQIAQSELDRSGPEQLERRTQRRSWQLVPVDVHEHRAARLPQSPPGEPHAGPYQVRQLVLDERVECGALTIGQDGISEREVDPVGAAAE